MTEKRGVRRGGARCRSYTIGRGTPSEVVQGRRDATSHESTVVVVLPCNTQECLWPGMSPFLLHRMSQSAFEWIARASREPIRDKQDPGSSTSEQDPRLPPEVLSGSKIPRLPREVHSWSSRVAPHRIQGWPRGLRRLDLTRGQHWRQPRTQQRIWSSGSYLSFTALLSFLKVKQENISLS